MHRLISGIFAVQSNSVCTEYAFEDVGINRSNIFLKLCIRMEEQDRSRLKNDPNFRTSRKKRKADSGSPMKRRNVKRKHKEQQDISGSLRFYVKSEDAKVSLYNKVDKCKLLIGEKISSVSNQELLNDVLDFYLQSHGVNSEKDNNSDKGEIKYTSYLQAEQENHEEEHFLVSKSALRNITGGLLQHYIECKSLIDIDDIVRFGHVGKIKFRCQNNHTLKMDTSPHIEGGKYLANLQIIHGLYMSGLRYGQYERFCEGSFFGCCPESSFSNNHSMYCDVTSATAFESIKDALLEEEVLSINDAHTQEQEYEGITILTDARHSTRRNAKQSDIIALGAKTHKVVGAVTVTKEDDPVSQRHEIFGVKRLYQHFDACDVTIHIHGHDRNASVNKFVKQEQPLVDNANDTWHAAKGVTKVIKPTGHGSKKMHGKTWHKELSDKAASVKTHVYYAMKNCNGSEEQLRRWLDNIVPHYQQNHTHCSPRSRCKTDTNYIPSKVTIKDSVAAKLLTDAIHSLQVYKTPKDYIHCIDTHYVESYNNACLIFHDKRISFGLEEYKRRSAMAVLDWNENVDREYTSITMWEDIRNPRRQIGSKNLKRKTFLFKNTIYRKIIQQIYSSNG